MSDENSLCLLAYTSVASHHMTHDELINLLSQARDNNSHTHITGMLLYMEGCFFQVIEGQRDLLEALFDKISKDKRHHHVMKLIIEPINERSFANWTMGFQHVTPEELANVTGITDFLDRSNHGFDAMESSRARKLIEQYREGRWFRNDLTQYKMVNMGG